MTRIIEKNRKQLKEAIRIYRYEQGHGYDETIKHFEKEFGRKMARKVYNELRDEMQDKEQKKFIADLDSDSWGCIPPLSEATTTPFSKIVDGGDCYRYIRMDEPGLTVSDGMVGIKLSQPTKTVSGSRVKLVVGLPDLHLPYKPETALAPSAKAAIKWCQDNKPDEIVLMGDFMSFKCISHWDAMYPGRKKNDFLSRDIQHGNYVLDMLQGITSKITYLRGNHEAWLDQYRDKDPQARDGIYELESVFRIYDRRIDLIPENVEYRVGKSMFVHGHRVGMYHARWTADDFGENVFYGHTHDIQSHSKSKRAGSEPIIAHSCGCLCDENPDYLRNKPNRWAAGFLIMYGRDDGSFTYYVPQIVGGRFIGLNGKEYAG
jgi:predicted phosphodiesterase